MRSNRSSTNVDHETRRNDYYYHHSRSSSQSNNTENVNGHSTSSSESHNRSSKRTTTSSSSNSTTATGSSTSLIKRMKSSSNSVSNTTNTSNSVNAKESGKDNQKSTSHSTTIVNSNSNSLTSIEPNECHQMSLSGYVQEENESLGEDNISEKATTDFDKYSDTAHQLKKMVLEILDAKKNKLKKKNSNKDDNKKFFSDSKIKGILSMAEMKNLNRLDKYRLKECRKHLVSSKDRVDKIHLQLQNLQYEVMHLQKEQKTCSSFRSKDEALQLIDSDKFYLSNSVPEDLKHLISMNRETNKILISEAATNDEIHQLHLARLDWELKQRISSEDELKLAEESRFRLEVEISAKRRTLAQFDPTLRTIIEASKPLVSQLNVPLQVYNISHSLTPFLPQPLYVLYIQLCAYKGVFGVNYEVNINGTQEEAQEYQAKVKSELNGHFFNLDDDDDENGKNLDEDDDEIGHRSKSKKSRFYHHHHSSTTAQTETSAIAAGAGALNLTTNGSVVENNTVVEPMDVSIGGGDNVVVEVNKNENFIKKYAKLLQAHPIRVNLTFRFRHYHLICTFTYYPKFELIGLKYVIENLSYSTAVHPQFSVTSYESNVFSKLFKSSDTGYSCPNSSIEHLLRRYEIDSFVKLLPYLGFTYDWAQRMAGIEYLNSDEQPIVSSCGNIRVKSSVAIDSLDKTVKAINFRFQARINLQEQIQEVQSKKCIDTNKFESLLDSNEMYDNLNQQSLKPKSTITLFERLNVETFLTEMDKFPNKKSQLVEYFDRDDDDGGLTNDIFDENNFIFKLVIENVLTVQLDDDSSINQTRYVVTAYLIVPHNYPEKWPFFILTLDSDLLNNLSSYLESSWLRSLEEHINLRLPIKVYEQGKKLEESLYSTTLLLRQIYDLQRGLDVICEAREKLYHKSNQSLEVYSGPKCVNSFVSMSIIQGRDHSLKFD